MRVKLNATIVNALEAGDKPYSVRDSGQPGLTVIVWPGGAKTFTVEARRHGRLIKRKLGPWPELSVTSARERTAQLLAGAAETKGLVPITFGELFAKRLAISKAKNRTWQEDQRKFVKHLGAWAKRPVSQIKQEDVKRLRNEIAGQHGEVTANRLLSLVKTVFAHGVETERYLTSNPAANVGKYREAPRDRFLTTAELPRFLSAVQLEPVDYCDIFTLLLFTGARSGNVCEMRWDELDLDKGVWVIPSQNSKNGRVLFLPIAGAAIEILDRRRYEFAELSQWVFPAPHNATGHITELRRPWERVCKRAELNDLRMHDLRHSLASWQAMNGASLQIIGKSLGHADMRSTERYSHLQLDIVRASVEAAVGRMVATRKGETDGL